MCIRIFNIRQILRRVMPGAAAKKDIHSLLAETIAERKKILEQWEKLFRPRPSNVKKDIHGQLEETIAELKKAKQYYGTVFSSRTRSAGMFKNKKAA